jgi:uroporphyrinogen decarboxylase
MTASNQPTQTAVQGDTLMSANDDRMKSMLFDHPSTIPVEASILPAAWMKYREEMDAIVRRHPIVFGEQSDEPRDYDAVSDRYTAGEMVDAWGCVWSNMKSGMDAIVTGHPVPTRESIRTLQAPEENMGFPHGFMFLRLTDLRGFTESMMDFAEEPPELQMLLDIVRDYNLRQGEIALAELTDPQIVSFGDDLGMQNSLPMSPEAWRKYLKPCFAAIYKPFRDAGHYIYMHTDGHILEIIPDLVDCGVNIVNPQYRANGLAGLIEVAKGKICIDLDLDRQMFPFCSAKDIDDHIEECVRKLGAPEGGLWLKAEIGDDVPLELVEAICVALEKHRSYFST